MDKAEFERISSMTDREYEDWLSTAGDNEVLDYVAELLADLEMEDC